MIHKAKDLSPDQRQLIESLIGRRVLEGEAVSVRAFEPAAVSDERRKEIVEALKRYFAEVDASRKAASSVDAEEVLTEAMRSSRPGYRSRP